MDPDDELQRVVRPVRSGVWIGVWAVGLGAVVLVALMGSSVGAGSAPSAAPVAIEAAASPAPTASPSPSSTPWEGIPALRGGPTPQPPPVTMRPPLGEDGLIGGIVFGTNLPSD